jgi:hypothetical protein
MFVAPSCSGRCPVVAGRRLLGAVEATTWWEIGEGRGRWKRKWEEWEGRWMVLRRRAGDEERVRGKRERRGEEERRRREVAGRDWTDS